MADRVGNLVQTLGLGLMNAVARSGGYRKSSYSFGDGERMALDWYVVDPDAPTVIFYYGGN